MLNKDELKAEITRQYGDIKRFATAVGIPVARVYKGLNKRQFGHKDMEKIQGLLKFKDPWGIFFAPELPREDKHADRD